MSDTVRPHACRNVTDKEARAKADISRGKQRPWTITNGTAREVCDADQHAALLSRAEGDAQDSRAVPREFSVGHGVVLGLVNCHGREAHNGDHAIDDIREGQRVDLIGFQWENKRSCGGAEPPIRPTSINVGILQRTVLSKVHIVGHTTEQTRRAAVTVMSERH